VATSFLGDDNDADSRAAAAITNAPERYRIVYRLEEVSGDDTLVTTEEVIVERPFWSRRTLWDGDGTVGSPTRVSISGFGFLSVRTPTSDDFTTATAITPATGDLRFEHALAALVEAGLVERRGQQTVLSERCDVYRVLEPIGAGRVLPATTSEWSDACIDRRGLVLHEDWVLDGRLFQRKRAIAVDVDPAIRDREFEPFSESLTPERGGGAVRAVDPDSRPSFTLWELDEPPEGFSHRGRYEVLVASGRRTSATQSQISPPYSDVVDVYERGRDFISISRGSFVDRDQEFDRRPHGIEIDLGDIGVGEIEIGVYGSFVRVKTDAVQFVAIRGTVHPDQLVQIARALRPGERGQLVYLDEHSRQ